MKDPETPRSAKQQRLLWALSGVLYLWIAVGVSGVFVWQSGSVSVAWRVCWTGLSLGLLVSFLVLTELLRGTGEPFSHIPALYAPWSWHDWRISLRIWFRLALRIDHEPAPNGRSLE